MTNFDYAMAFIFHWEGGLVDNPNDPGKLTNMGISQASFPHLDIRELTKEEASEIYHQYYWLPSQSDKFTNPKMARINMDTAVNCGVSTALHMTRQIGGNYTDNNPARLNEYYELRKQYYLNLIAHNPHLKEFEAGWMNRLNAVMA
jgi:lysozyme family protein